MDASILISIILVKMNSISIVQTFLYFFYKNMTELEKALGRGFLNKIICRLLTVL